MSPAAEAVAFTALVSPGATVYTSIGPIASTLASSSVHATEDSSAVETAKAAVPPRDDVAPSSAPAPFETAGDVDEEWGDFDSFQPPSVVPVSAAATSVSPTPSVSTATDEGDDWSGFGETSVNSMAVSSLASSAVSSVVPSPSHAHSSSSSFTSHSPLPSFLNSASPSPLPDPVNADFLDLPGPAFTADVQQKLHSIFSDALHAAKTQAQLPPPAPTEFTGPPCVSCGAPTPTLASPAAVAAFTRLPPRFCVFCGRPSSAAVAAVLGPALVALPKWKTTVAYLSIFSALQLPLPAPLVPRLAKNAAAPAQATEDEDGLKPNAADEAAEEKDDGEDGEGAVALKARASPTGPGSARASPVANGGEEAKVKEAVAVKTPPVEKERAKTPVASRAEKEKERAREEEKERKAKAEKEKEKEREASKESPRDRERRSSLGRTSPSPSPSPPPGVGSGEKKKTTTVVGKLSKFLPSSASISQSISSGLASISPQHAAQKAQKAAAAAAPSSSSASSPPALAPPPSAAPSGSQGSGGSSGPVDVAAVVKRINELVKALPDLSWVTAGTEQ